MTEEGISWKMYTKMGRKHSNVSKDNGMLGSAMDSSGSGYNPWSRSCENVMSLRIEHNSKEFRNNLNDYELLNDIVSSSLLRKRRMAAVEVFEIASTREANLATDVSSD
jgi:hypothetical protein